MFQITPEALVSEYGDVATQIGVFVVVFVVVYVLGRTVLRPLVLRAIDYADVSATLRYGLQRFGHVMVVVLTLIVAAIVTGFAQILAASAVILAALTVSVGVAAREVTSNFISGIVIIMDRSLNYGDWIKFDGVEGEIVDIGYRATRVRTFDNELVTIPNSLLVSNRVTNVAINDRLRFSTTFGIGYDADIDEARQVLIAEAFGHDEVLETPEPFVRLVEFAGSYVGLKVFLWVDDPVRSEVVRIRSEYSERVKRRFDEEGIEIQPPSPHRLSGELDVDTR